MDRRALLKALSVSGFMVLGSGSVMRQLMQMQENKLWSPTAALQGQLSGRFLATGLEDFGQPDAVDLQSPLPSPTTSDLAQQTWVEPKTLSPETQTSVAKPVAQRAEVAQVDLPSLPKVTNTAELEQRIAKDPEVHAYLQKIRNFEAVYDDDHFLAAERMPLLRDTLKRLERVQRTVGHGNFNLLSFDQALKYGRNFSQVGEFSREEQAFLEELFFANAQNYGFFGDKVTTGLTERISEREVDKMPGTGHYLYKGKPQSLYTTLRRDVGDSLILTSGVRSVVKQMHLFLSKAVQSEGNLSKASRSLAPPGYSYHGIGDFDVGRVGFGYRNFTADFAQTDEYKRLQDLGYISIRYTSNNRFGVRYEPWHIQVV